MKINSINKLEKSIVELEIAVEETVFKKAVDEAFAKTAPNITVPGFRKGHAPRKMIERMYGTGQFYEQAINATYEEAYDAAIEESGIEAVGRAEMDIKSVDETGYVFTVKIPVRPEITLGRYKGLKAEKNEVKITAAQVDEELEHIRKSHARTVEVTGRAAQKGDTAIIDFEGFVEGVAFDGGKGENYNLVLGSGSFIPGFEEQLIGKNAGDETTVNVTFPEEYHEKSLAGKAAQFNCKIHELKVEQLPELDDDFAKDVSEFDTLADYKTDIKKNLTAQAQSQADRAVEQQLLDAVVEDMQADVPDAMVEGQIDTMVSEYDQNMRRQGLDLATYLKYIDSDMTSFRQNFQEPAEKTVRSRLALEEVVKAENIVVGEEEIEAEYKRVSEGYGVELEQVKAFIPADQLTMDLAVDIALKFVVAQAEVKTVKETAKKPTSGKAGEDEKPAQKKETAEKKPAAKKPAAKK